MISDSYIVAMISEYQKLEERYEKKVEAPDSEVDVHSRLVNWAILACYRRVLEDLRWMKRHSKPMKQMVKEETEMQVEGEADMRAVIGS